MRVLFVCHGNTCRSPAAEALVRKIASENGLALHLDSAGISADRLGAPATSAMQKIALAAGYDLGGLQARQVTTADYSDFDLMIGMDKSVVSALKVNLAEGAEIKITGFTDFCAQDAPDEIVDPWHTGDYSAAFALIHSAARAFVACVKADQLRQ